MTELAVPISQMGLEPDHFDQYHDVYHDIFLMLGADKEDTDTLERAVEVSQEWIHGDYGHDDGLPVELTAEKRIKLRQLCVDGLGMGSAGILPPGEYAKLKFYGASQFGNIGRAGLMHELLESDKYRFDQLVLFGGPRQLYPKEVPGFGRLLNDKNVVAAAKNDEWLAGIKTDYEKIFHENTDLLKVNPLDYMRFGETTQMHVSMVKAFGSVALLEERTVINQWTGKPVGVKEFELAGGAQATLLHCPEVERLKGPARHTSESCTIDGLNVLGAKKGEQTVFIGAPPHITRMGLTIMRAYTQAGRPDVSVRGVGQELTHHTPVEIMVSEVSKTLYEAWLLKQQPA